MMTLVFTTILAASTHFALPSTLTIVKNGKSNWAISIMPSTNRDVGMFGARELQAHIQAISGVKLPIISGGSPELKRLVGVISIGTSPRFDRRQPLAPEEYRIVTVPRRPIPKPKNNREDLVTWSGDQIYIIGGGSRGTLYGCYAFLEDVCGCRWFTPTISRIPKRKAIVVKAMDIRQMPAFEYREPYYRESFDGLWAVRNRTNGNMQKITDEMGGHVVYGRFVHTFEELVDPKQYFDSHPEYFSLINGKRMKGYYQLCLTNPDVLRITIGKVRQWIKENPKATIFSVSQNDTYNNCQCENCMAIEREEGAPSGVLMRFVNAVADAIAEQYPNVLIDTLAYQWTEDPPKLARPHKNVRIRLAPIGACFGHPMDGCEVNKKAYANLQAWAKITNQLYVWHYSTNFANYLQPLPDLDEIARDIKLFKKNGVVGLFYEGDYAAGGGGEMSELKAYLMARLMWNPDRDPRPIIDEFLTGVYGKAAPYIKQWLDLLHADILAGKYHPKIYDPPTAPYLSDSLLAEGFKLFDQAARAVQTDYVALDQVERAELALEYVQLMRTPPTDPAYKEKAKVVADKIRRYGIGEVREGQPVSTFLQKIGQ